MSSPDGSLRPLQEVLILRRPQGAYQPVVDEDGDLSLLPAPEPAGSPLVPIPTPLDPLVGSWIGTLPAPGSSPLPRSRTYLLHGPSGSGKTITLLRARARLLEASVLALISADPESVLQAIETVRRVDPECPVACLFDGIEEMDVGATCAFLDQAAARAGILVLMTARSPELLDERLAANPARIAEMVAIEPPGADARRRLLAARFPASSPADIEACVAATRGCPIAVIAEVAERCVLGGIAPDRAVRQLRACGMIPGGRALPRMGFDLRRGVRA